VDGVNDSATRYRTRELSTRTFPDFERFFTQVHGCACTLYFFGRHLSPVAGTTQQRVGTLGSTPDRSQKQFPQRDLARARELAAVKELVDRGQARGILVYADDDPVGWCHFGRVDELPVPSEESVPNITFAREPSTDWVITCFTTRMDYRRQGVATSALTAAVAAITKAGGGWIEAVPMAFPHDDPTVRKLRRTFGWRSSEVADYLRNTWPRKELLGIGQLSACLTTSRTMGHMGSMSMFEKAGFAAIRRDEQRSTDDPRYPRDFVVMRLRV
jgi:ribosomal protein S18 acetylase RimI-like enzyme